MQTGSLGRVGRRLTAILAADVVGYSRLMEADEVGTARLLRERYGYGGELRATARDSKLDFPAISAPASSRRIPWPLLSPY